MAPGDENDHFFQNEDFSRYLSFLLLIVFEPLSVFLNVCLSKCLFSTVLWLVWKVIYGGDQDQVVLITRKKQPVSKSHGERRSICATRLLK